MLLSRPKAGHAAIGRSLKLRASYKEKSVPIAIGK
jgi:hypothetical protein